MRSSQTFCLISRRPHASLFRCRKNIAMKINALIAIAAVMIGISSPVFAGTTYQATGPVLELTDAKIVIQKGKEKWEIARTADTKVTGDLKVGEKVTIEYTMTAVTIEAKPDKAAPPAKTKPAK